MTDINPTDNQQSQRKKLPDPPANQSSSWIPVYYVPNAINAPTPTLPYNVQQGIPVQTGYANPPITSNQPALNQSYQQIPPQPILSFQQPWVNQNNNKQVPTFLGDTISEDSTIAENVSVSKDPAQTPHPNVPAKSYAFDQTPEDKLRKKTNTGRTKIIMSLLSEMWIIHMLVILGGVYLLTFEIPQGYTDAEIWNDKCWYKIGWMFPLPYTFVCFFGLIMPFRTPKFLYRRNMPRRRIDNLYILTVTKGANKEAVYRAWNAHKHLESLHPCIRVHVLTDEPYFFENINCYTCPKAFISGKSKYKARALEWYRQTMRFTEYDWILHLDEESVIDDESVKACLEFIWYETDCHWGQGLIFYNQYKYWQNWLFTVADSLRVGDDLSRFALQYTYFRRPIFGAHGSFLMTNGLVENAVTWDLGSLTEDYQFAVKAWKKGFKCGKIAGIIREQSPQNLMDFLKQRRRWYVGIRRLPNFLPKLWAFFWTVGSLALYGTIISVVISLVFPTSQTPRWFGLLKDFTFATFVYLYLLGNFIQDIDKGTFPLLVLIRIPVTFILQFIASIMECAAVMYGIVQPPHDFDVIKK